MMISSSHVSELPSMSGSGSNFSGWNFSRSKRFFDAACATLGLVLATPLMILIAAAIKITMPGPILFRQTRIGRNSKPFQILKFRTMVVRTPGPAPNVTRRGDSRITPLGRVLRRLKLDELPQLFNMLRGDMSLVGPRPDVPEYCQTLAGERRAVLSLAPGLTGWATVHFRDEERILAVVPEQQLSSHYVKTVLPAKVDLDLQYARRATFFGDLVIVVQTFTGARPESQSVLPSVPIPEANPPRLTAKFDPDTSS
jgi:lipopolysaccharide/colanic/teichoic acid biosynthesis glycosyltransferase